MQKTKIGNIRKIREQANLSVTEYKSKFIKLVYLNDDVDTELERYLISYYGELNLFNGVGPGGAVLINNKSVKNGIKIWDLKSNILCDTSNINKFCREHNISNVSKLIRNLITKNRFCLLENKEEAQIKYDYINQNITLYKMIDDKIISKTLMYKEWIRTGIYVDTLLNKEQTNSYGWYLDKTILEKQLTYITLYHKTENQKTLMYKDWAETDYTLKYVIDGTYIHSSGWYLNKEDVGKTLDYLTLYKENDYMLDNVEEKTLSKEEWIELECKKNGNNNIRKILEGNILSSNGWYTNKEDLLQQIKLWTVYYKEDNKIKFITLKYYELVKQIGDIIKKVIDGTRKHHNGYALTPENIPQNYTKPTIHITHKEDKVLTYRFDKVNVATIFEFMSAEQMKEHIRVIDESNNVTKSNALFNGKRKSVCGLYVCKDEYSKKYNYYTLYNENTQESISGFYMDLYKIVNDNKNFSTLTTGNQKSVNGWTLLHKY